MAHARKQREQLRAHCGELHADDGVDPRDFFRPDRQRTKLDRKTRQLCQQVQQTLMAAARAQQAQAAAGAPPPAAEGR